MQRHEFCTLKHTPVTPAEQNTFATDDTTSVGTATTSEIFNLMNQFLELQRLRNENNK